MPKSFSGLISFAVMAVVTVVLGMYIVNRVGFLGNLVYGGKKAA